ncbi:MAG: hypothetical protein HLUCCO18_02805 [Rhodobacteraceae bacterium HLUCCO18]|nr:MAG: hypothetical protein HLUCCO18_02805 [Rhodobacteraceae bacterium HLUCCO18]
MRGCPPRLPGLAGMGHRSRHRGPLTGRGRRRARHLTRMFRRMTRSTRQKPSPDTAGLRSRRPDRRSITPAMALRWTSPRRRPDPDRRAARRRWRQWACQPSSRAPPAPTRRRGPQPPPSFPCHMARLGTSRRPSPCRRKARFQWTEAGAIGPASLGRSLTPRNAQRRRRPQTIHCHRGTHRMRYANRGRPSRTHPARPGSIRRARHLPHATRCHRALPSRCLRASRPGRARHPGRPRSRAGPSREQIDRGRS